MDNVRANRPLVPPEDGRDFELVRDAAGEAAGKGRRIPLGELRRHALLACLTQDRFSHLVGLLLVRGAYVLDGGALRAAPGWL